MNNFDQEFKRIVDGLDIDVRPGGEHKDKLRWQMMSEFNDARAHGGSTQGGFYRIRSFIMDRKFASITAAAVIIAAVLIGIAVFGGADDGGKEFVQEGVKSEKSLKGEKGEGQSVVAKGTDGVEDAKIGPVRNSAKDALEIERVNELYAAKDFDGLVEVLKTGSMEVKLAVANYLADMGGDGALEELKKLAGSWEGKGDNPFTPLVKKIKAGGGSDAGVTDANSVKDSEAINSAAGGDSAGDSGAAAIAVDKDNELDTAFGLKVVDKITGKPVVGAEVMVMSSRGRKMTTNRLGRCLIDFGQAKPKFVTIEVKYGKYVPRRIHYNPSYNGIEIPKNYLMALETGTVIGGIVKTESGQPVADATVKVTIHEVMKKVDNPAIGSLPCKTDNDGRWVCEVIPTNAKEIYLDVVHSVLVGVEKYGSMASIDMLRNKNHVLLMRGGIDVVGSVVDLDGKPIVGADVFQGYSRNSSEPKTKTDAEGKFRFDKCSPGEMVLSVKAAGFAQDMKEVQVAEGLKEIEFVLNEGGTIIARVVDVDGKPLKNVRVEATEWRQRSMSQEYQNIRIKENTDAEGLAVLMNVPDEEIIYNISKGVFATINKLPLKPSEDEQEIVLWKRGKLVGGVFDVATGEAIKEFTQIEGIQWERSNNSLWKKNKPIWQSHKSKKVTGGRFEQPFKYHVDGYAVKIVADGYLPAESPVFYNEGVTVEHDIYLSRGEGPSGFVYLPDGTPAVEAEVIMGTGRDPIRITDNSVRRDDQNIFAATDKNGAFKMPAFEGNYKLVVLHKDGIAIVTKAEFEEGNVILLKKWGRVEGVLFNGTEFAVDTEVRLLKDYMTNLPGVEIQVIYYQEVKTNNKGKFVFDKVIPGELTASKKVRLTNRSWSYAKKTPVKVVAGETTVVDIGGGGRAVIGKVLLPSGFSVKNLRDGGFRLDGKPEKGPAVELPEIDVPEDILVMSLAERTEWQTKWMQTDEGKAAMKKIMESQVGVSSALKNYPVPMEADGSFIVEDVFPGRYEFSGRIYDAALKGKPEYYRDWIYEIKYEIVVPELKEDSPVDKPFDVGGIAVSPVKKLKAGGLAPAFDLKGIDGSKVNLGSFKGKYLLLERSMGNRSDFNEKILPKLQELYKEFGGEKFDVLTVYPSYGRKSDLMKKPIKYYVDYFDIKWTIGIAEINFIGEIPKILEDYGTGISVMHLIGPDGKIVAIESDIDKMKKTVEELLTADE